MNRLYSSLLSPIDMKSLSNRSLPRARLMSMRGKAMASCGASYPAIVEFLTSQIG